jgi:hypothetical protein
MPRAFDEGHGGENFSPQEFLRLSIFFGMSLSPFWPGKRRLQATDIFDGKFFSFLLKDSFWDGRRGLSTTRARLII